MAHAKTLSRIIINMLLDVGRTVDFEAADFHRQLTPLASYGWINTRTPNEWRSAVSARSSPDLAVLVKTLAMAEHEFQWMGGSVSAAIWIFQVLVERDKGVSTKVADWVLPRTSNPYVPFGHTNLGATSVRDYETRRRRREEQKATAQQKAKDAAEIRRVQRATVQAARRQSHAARIEQRREFIASFMQLTLPERLELIARDPRPLAFFPNECAEVDARTLGRLGSDTRRALLQRLLPLRRGPWRALRERLISLSLAGGTEA